MSTPFPPIKSNQIKPCSAKNNGQGCNRGFLREKCSKCTNGSLACEMCLHQRNRNGSTSSLLLQRCPFPIPSTATTTTAATIQEKESKEQPVAFASLTGSLASPPIASPSTLSVMGSALLASSTRPRLGLNDASTRTAEPCPSSAEATSTAAVATVKTVSILYQLPLPSGHPQRSLVSSTPSTPAPSKDFKLSIITLPSSLPPSSTLTSPSSTEMELTTAPTISPPASPLLVSSPFTSSPRSLTVSTTITAMDPRILSQSCPSSPLYALGRHPFGTTSASCIFCFNGRKACDDCFGLGYVQRICQDCLRDLHQNRNHPSQRPQPQQQQPPLPPQNESRPPYHHRQKSLPTLPTASLPAVHMALNQIGTKIKKQFFPQLQQQQQQQQPQPNRRLSLSESAVEDVASPSDLTSTTTTTEHTTSSSSGPGSTKFRMTMGLRRSHSTNSDNRSSSELKRGTPTLTGVLDKGGLFRGSRKLQQTPLQAKQTPPQLRSKSMVSLGIRSPRLGPLEEEEGDVVSHDDLGDNDVGDGGGGEDKVDQEGYRDGRATAIGTETETGTGGPRDREKKSFRAAVLRALKLTGGQKNSSSNKNGNSENNARPPPHRHPWSLSVTNIASTTSTS